MTYLDPFLMQLLATALKVALAAWLGRQRPRSCRCFQARSTTPRFSSACGGCCCVTGDADGACGATDARAGVGRSGATFGFGPCDGSRRGPAAAKGCWDAARPPELASAFAKATITATTFRIISSLRALIAVFAATRSDC